MAGQPGGVVTWTQFEEAIAGVPPAVWVALVLLNVVVMAATWSAAKRRVRRAGERAVRSGDATPVGRAKDAALTVATLVPAVFFFVMVLAGSFHGLVAFGYHTLGWRGGWELLVPATLDGVSLAFAMLAFRAVRRGKSPDRCYRVVWIAAAASATINFGYEYGSSGNVLAGGYVGLLSLFAMFMFDEFLAQFEEGAQTLRRENPKFGLRWLSWPSNTFCAAVAWRNHPPVEGTPGTVRNAVENLEWVRAHKRAVRGRGGSVRSATTVAIRARTDPAAATSLTDEPGGPSPPVLASGGRANRRRHPPVRPSGGESTARRRLDESEARVPATAATVRQWIDVWMSLCADPAAATGPLTDDEVALTRFGVRARQLRNIRYAASTGALRRRAEELEVDLPPNFVDMPDRPMTGATIQDGGGRS